MRALHLFPQRLLALPRAAALFAVVALAPACAHAPAAPPPAATKATGQPVAAPPASPPHEERDVELRSASSFALSPSEAAGMVDPGAAPQDRAVDKEVVRRVIRSHVADLKECSDPALA